MNLICCNGCEGDRSFDDTHTPSGFVPAAEGRKGHAGPKLLPNSKQNGDKTWSAPSFSVQIWSFGEDSPPMGWARKARASRFMSRWPVPLPYRKQPRTDRAFRPSISNPHALSGKLM